MGELISQKMRSLAPEQDPLRLGAGWTPGDLSKPQILVESTGGDSHPGSVHLGELAAAVCRGIREAGGFGARYCCTDICDGESQGTDGMNLSLPSREFMANMMQIHALATPFDGSVYLSSCDKGLPACLMALARVDAPALVVPGGVMAAGPELLTLEQLGAYSARYQRGEIGEDTLRWAKENACPGCGACSFIGTASSMQILTEALGLALPGSALLPANGPLIGEYARRAGERAVAMAGCRELSPSRILTREAFENAIVVHAAISGSTNCLLHLPAIAHELGISLTGEDFDRLHRDVPWLLNLRPAGKWPAECFHYAGGVPALMEQLRDRLHLDAMTVTGRTLGENLEALKGSGYYERCAKALADFNRRRGCSLSRENILLPRERPLGSSGAVAVLRGNLAPEGAVIKHTACPPQMHRAVLRARPFDSEEACLQAVVSRRVQPGDALFIRYEGPRGSGMPEMFYTTEAISSDPELGRSIALITDGRFSGASTGPAIGHCSPEAAQGGPIALVEEGDLIEIDIPNRGLNIVGIGGVRKSAREIEQVLARRRAAWKPKPTGSARGALAFYSRLAASPMQGAYLDLEAHP